MPDEIGTGASLRIELLGAPRVVRDGAAVRVPVKKSLALLAYLALEGRATRAKLAALFWGESDAEAARRNLRRELHRLREIGLGDLVTASDDALSLTAGACCDAATLLQALERGGELPEWRGALLDGFDLGESEAFDAWLGARREDLARRWTKAALARAQEHEAGGNARAAAAVFARLIELDPLQESHYANAMRLSYLAGERARALEYFERCRAVLRAELGLEPLPATAALAEQVRAAERIAPLVARGGVRGLARFDARMVGRDTELATLRTTEFRTLLLEGEPGVGKSRLATEFALDRSPLLRMQGAELGRGAALHAVSEAIRLAVLDPAVRTRLGRLAPEQLGEVARLVPAVDEARQAEAAPAVGSRTRFFEALAAAFESMLDAGTLVVDDLHWLDDSSLELVETLARRLAAARSAGRIIATARSAELAEAQAATDMVRKLERAGLLARVHLQPLALDSTLDLIRQLSGSHGGELFAQRLQRASQGNPFLLLETLRYLFDIGELAVDERGQWSTVHDEVTRDYGELPVPPTVQQALDERVQRLGPAARRLLEAAALAGDPFTLTDVQPATALTEWDAVDGLERSLQAQVLLQTDGGYRYVHDLARSAIAAGLRPERRQLIHLRLAEAFEVRQERPDRIAAHFQAAGRPARALPWHLAAARAAERIYAWREALAHYAAALQAGADPPLQIEIRRARCALHRHLFAHLEIMKEAEALQALALKSGDAALRLEAAVWRVRALDMAENTTAASELAQETLRQAGGMSLSPALAHDLQLAVVRGLHGRGELDAAWRQLEQVRIHLAEVDPARQLEAHFQHAFLLVSRNEPVQAQAPLELARSLAVQTDNVEMYCKAGGLLGYVLHTGGRTREAVQVMEQAQARAEQASLLGEQRSLLTNLIKLHVLLHDAPAAQARMQQALKLFADQPDPATQSRLQSRMTEVALLAGDLGAALASSAASIALLQSLNAAAGTFWPWYQRARLLWQLGDCDGAIQVYRELRKSPVWSPVIEPAVEFFTLAFGLPANAQEIGMRLQSLPVPAGQPYVDATDRGYWSALAVLTAGDAPLAQRLLADLGPPSFNLHEANLVALQLRAAQAAGAPTALLLAKVQALQAPPLDRLELLAAVAAVLDATGDTAAAQALNAFDSLGEALLASLPAEYAASFRARLLALRA